jgi:hypothetical protein
MLKIKINLEIKNQIYVEVQMILNYNSKIKLINKIIQPDLLIKKKMSYIRINYQNLIISNSL